MKTFIKTQQDINNIYCPQRTKPKDITKQQWNEARNQWTIKKYIELHQPIRSNEAKEHMLESQFINRRTILEWGKYINPYSNNSLERNKQIRHDINVVLKYAQQEEEHKSKP